MRRLLHGDVIVAIQDPTFYQSVFSHKVLLNVLDENITKESMIVLCIVCCSMYYLFCVVLCIVCVYMCTVLLPPGGYPHDLIITGTSVFRT
jgi:hypothetical protein